jgi:multidrug efflux pump subunit AcrB
MKISDLSIRRPVLASMLSLALVLFGAIGYTSSPFGSSPT